MTTDAGQDNAGQREGSGDCLGPRRPGEHVVGPCWAADPQEFHIVEPFSQESTLSQEPLNMEQAIATPAQIAS